MPDSNGFNVGYIGGIIIPFATSVSKLANISNISKIDTGFQIAGNGMELAAAGTNVSINATSAEAILNSIVNFFSGTNSLDNLNNTISDNNEVNNILKEKKLTNQTNKVDNYESPIKGNDQAKKDFDKLNLKNIREYENRTIAGDLPDGRTVNIHPSTTLEGTPSLEIYNSVTKKSIKIRY